MNLETKQDVLERILAHKKPVCPHCENEMHLWEVPDVACGDGLGWGTPFLYICFNDDCPSYKSGWDDIKDQFAYDASYRCMNFPGTTNFEFIPVFSPEGAKGQIITDETLREQEAIKEATKIGFSTLTDFYMNRDWFEILKMLLDPNQPSRVRVKAAEMIGDIADMDAIEPLINHKFPNRVLIEAVSKAVKKLHERHFTMECPYCAEIVKKRAKLCKSCGKDLTQGQ